MACGEWNLYYELKKMYYLMTHASACRTSQINLSSAAHCNQPLKYCALQSTSQVLRIANNLLNTAHCIQPLKYCALQSTSQVLRIANMGDTELLSAAHLAHLPLFLMGSI